MNTCEKCNEDYKSHGMTTEFRTWHSGQEEDWGRVISDSFEIRGLCPKCGDALTGIIYTLSRMFVKGAVPKYPRIPEDFLKLIRKIPVE
jgi:hypothetical protein